LIDLGVNEEEDEEEDEMRSSNENYLWF